MRQNYDWPDTVTVAERSKVPRVVDWTGVLIGFAVGYGSGFLASLLAIAVGEGLRRPHFEFKPDVGEPDPQGWRFVSVSVQNKRRPWIVHFLDETAALCTASVEFRDEATGALVIDPLDARWPTFQPEPFEPVTGRLHVGAVLIPHRETIPPGGSASINVAVKHQGDRQCYGFNNRSYGFPQWRYPQQRLNCTRVLVRVIVNFEGRAHPSQAFILENPDASVAHFTLRARD